MASCSSPLSEEQFTCSICLEVFVDPVTTPCGHNFCKACITNYWDSNALCHCPMCMKNFDRKPELLINTMFRDVVEDNKKIREKEVSVGPGEIACEVPVGPGEVACDFCTGRKRKALKSCLVCLTSHCETHLEPHQRIATLKRHKLIDPEENLEDRMCRKHGKTLELFCRTDQACVCQLCTVGDHKTHDTVPLEEECKERKTQMKTPEGEVQQNEQMIQERLEKVQEIKRSVETSKTDTKRDISTSKVVFSTLVRSIKRNQAELIQVIEEKQKAVEKKAEGFIKDLEKEITELKERSTELEQLSHTEDDFHFLQSFLSLSTPPHTKDWSEISVHSDRSVRTVRRAVSQLGDTLNTEMEKLPEIKLNRIKRYAVDVTLDADTAYHWLLLSEDGKQVRHGDTRNNLPDNPKRFDDVADVLGKQGFSEKFYYEVQVEGKTDWNLGVASESINRKGNMALNPVDGYWAIWMKRGHKYEALDYPHAHLSLKEKPQKVGVFVDYEEGQVSFYDVEARSHIYSFTGYTFSEKLYPYFSPGLHQDGKNTAPLIITPVRF